jgi:hypothetical protein
MDKVSLGMLRDDAGLASPMISHLDGHDRQSGEATYSKYSHSAQHMTDEAWRQIEETAECSLQGTERSPKGTEYSLKGTECSLKGTASDASAPSTTASRPQLDAIISMHAGKDELLLRDASSLATGGADGAMRNGGFESMNEGGKSMNEGGESMNEGGESMKERGESMHGREAGQWMHEGDEAMNKDEAVGSQSMMNSGRGDNSRQAITNHCEGIGDGLSQSNTNRGQSMNRGGQSTGGGDASITASRHPCYEVLEGWWDHQLQPYRTTSDGNIVPNINSNRYYENSMRKKT